MTKTTIAYAAVFYQIYLLVYANKEGVLVNNIRAY